MAKLLFGEPQIKQPAVIREQLDAEPAEDALEIGGGEADLPGAHDDAPRPGESLEVVGGAGDRLAVAHQQAVAHNSTEILHG